ncbi:MAG: pyruvate dehydrogenase complex dihydrolipoamide acetyltransferase [Chlamydiales bacterium]
MPFTLTMPKLSPTMEEGIVAKWHKKEGDYVESGELLLEITTDKATVEHNALDAGYLRKILVPDGKGAKMNYPLAIFTEKREESIDGYQPNMPKEVTLAKVEAEVVAHKVEKREKVGASIGVPVHTPEPPLKNYSFEGKRTADERIAASPLAKKMARKKGLDITTVKGTGPGGRVTSRDLERAQPEGIVTFGRNKVPKESPGSYKEIELSPIRKVIAKRLQESKTFIPHFYIKQEVNATPMIEIREQLKELDLKVTFNDLIIRASALALTRHPKLNAGFNSVNNTIIEFKTVDVAVAVSIDDGLITPIIRHADFKNLGEISTEIRQLADKARRGKLTESEYKGGSFCISNLGMFGITEFTAVINPPQAAILAVGGIEDTPMIQKGKVVPGKRLTLTLSCDHRVVDGADGAEFIKTLQFLLEHPVSLALQ